jgi:hypothetical protein
LARTSGYVGGITHMTWKGSDERKRRRVGLILGTSLGILLVASACSPLDDEDDEPTATAGASIQGPNTSASPPSTPIVNNSQGTPGPPSNDAATPNAGSAGDTSAPESTPDDDASPVADSSPEASPDAGQEATPEESDAADSVVDSCEPDEIPAFAGDDPNYVVTTNLNFRTGPGQDCDPIGDGPLAEGSAVVVLSEPVTREGEDQEWVQIEVDGEPGWVAADFIEPAEQE